MGSELKHIRLEQYRALNEIFQGSVSEISNALYFCLRDHTKIVMTNGVIWGQAWNLIEALKNV